VARTTRHEREAVQKRTALLKYIRGQARIRGDRGFVFLRGSDLCERFGMSSHTLLTYLDALMVKGGIERYETQRGVGIKVWVKGENDA